MSVERYVKHLSNDANQQNNCKKNSFADCLGFKDVAGCGHHLVWSSDDDLQDPDVVIIFAAFTSKCVRRFGHGLVDIYDPSWPARNNLQSQI